MRTRKRSGAWIVVGGVLPSAGLELRTRDGLATAAGCGGADADGGEDAGAGAVHGEVVTAGRCRAARERGGGGGYRRAGAGSVVLTATGGWR